MKLLWKLLRRHISPTQIVTFFAANIIGTAIILGGYQFYRDIRPVFTADDSFMRPQHVIVSKTVGPMATQTPVFTADEISELARQPFCQSVAPFTPTAYAATVTMTVAGTTLPATSLTLESVPDRFTGVSPQHWHYAPGDTVVPVVIPRAWLAVYNFGLARTRPLPAIGDALASTIRVDISIGNRDTQHYEGRVVAISSRAATILVPQSFTEHTNRLYAPQPSSLVNGNTHPGPDPTRLIIEPAPSADNSLAQWIDSHHLQTDEDRLDSNKAHRLLQLITTIVVAVGLLISLLSIALLIVSIALLMQKNREKTQTLLRLGYAPSVIARPYLLLAHVASLASLLIALAAALALRPAYMKTLYALYPQLPDGTTLHAVSLAAILAAALLLVNTIVVLRKI